MVRIWALKLQNPHSHLHLLQDLFDTEPYPIWKAILPPKTSCWVVPNSKFKEICRQFEENRNDWTIDRVGRLRSSKVQRSIDICSETQLVDMCGLNMTKWDKTSGYMSCRRLQFKPFGFPWWTTVFRPNLMWIPHCQWLCGQNDNGSFRISICPEDTTSRRAHQVLRVIGVWEGMEQFCLESMGTDWCTRGAVQVHLVLRWG